MKKPYIRPCTCGSTPAYRKSRKGDLRLLQLWCACDKPCGAVLIYRYPKDEGKMRQAGIDGWNLAG